MSSSGSNPKPFLLAKDGSILNIDHVVRITINSGKLTADMITGPSIDLPDAGSPLQELRDLALLLAINMRRS